MIAKSDIFIVVSSIVGSTKSESEAKSLSFFRLVTIGVAMDLQFHIPNLFNISTVYFP